MGSGVQIVDIVGEPGIGKTRLLHEFRAHAAQRRVWMLAGLCAPDGQQTPFSVFIDIVRSDFRVALGDEAATVESKLGEGLRGFGLSSEQNLGLLLNLLGREAPKGALSGLDGVLIGIRTRDLLVRIVRARSRQAPLILLLEDIHWLDSASEALLGNLVAIDETLPLLILHTRRPTYAPPWAGSARVIRLALDPLSARETFRLAQARLGVDQLPEALGALIAAKAEGNALFAEEIVSFLLERGVVTRTAAGITFDRSAVTTTLPHSIQSILASRVDQLPREARALLQTAAVIGRRFDPDLVQALTDGRSQQESSFAAMEAQDLIRRDEPTGDYAFKHGLVRDAIYDGLLSSRARGVAYEGRRRARTAQQQFDFRKRRIPRTSFRSRRRCAEGVQIPRLGRAQEPQCLWDNRSGGLFSQGVGLYSSKTPPAPSRSLPCASSSACSKRRC